MLICKTPDGKFCFRCAECFLAFDNPQDIADADRGYDAFDVAMSPPTREEIDQRGWGDYCVHEVIEPEPEGPAVEFRRSSE